MHLAFDIFQGVGIAVAVGIRPLLPALAVGALAAGDVQIDFKGTDYSFLQGAPFLLAVLVAAIALALIERRRTTNDGARDPLVLAIRALALAVGALLFAGALAQYHHASWPGLIGGVACAVVAIAATAPLLRRVRARLGSQGAPAVGAYAEGAAIAIAALSVLAPPVGVIALLLMGWLLLAGRRREGRKYAGLRILR